MWKIIKELYIIPEHLRRRVYRLFFILFYNIVRKVINMKEKIYTQTKAVIEEICEKAKLQKGNIFVIGGVRAVYNQELL